MQFSEKQIDQIAELRRRDVEEIHEMYRKNLELGMGMVAATIKAADDWRALAAQRLEARVEEIRTILGIKADELS